MATDLVPLEVPLELFRLPTWDVPFSLIVLLAKYAKEFEKRESFSVNETIMKAICKLTIRWIKNFVLSII